jgi:ketosteroid isomerase-like protein
MKRLKLLVTLVFALLVSVPACAQEPADKAVRAAITKFFESFNSGNVDETAAVWSSDAVDINVNGIVSGKTQLDARIAAELKMGLKFDQTVERVNVGKNLAWATGPYTITIPGNNGASTEIHGGWLQVLKRDGGFWKIQAASFTRFNAPSPTK